MCEKGKAVFTALVIVAINYILQNYSLKFYCKSDILVIAELMPIVI